METLFFCLLPSFVGGVAVRQFFRNWRAWTGAGALGLVSILLCWQVGQFTPIHALEITGGAIAVGALGREIFQGLAGWVQTFLRRNTGWLIAVTVVVATWFIWPSVFAQLLQLAVPVLVLVWWARSLFSPRKKRRR